MTDGGPGSWTRDEAYDLFPRIEDEFNAALDVSLEPRGPDQLYTLVAGFGLARGSVAVDVGCGEGTHSLRLARDLGLRVTGVDPVERHVLTARAAADGVSGVDFQRGIAEAIPLPDASVDLVWCRDVLVHVADLAAAYAEFRRVLRPGGRAIVYQMFGTGLLEPREARWLWRTMFVVPTSADPAVTEAAIAASGLRLDERLVIGPEWGEHAQETRGHPGRKLLHAARLARRRDEFVARYGAAACDVMMGDCLWHVYAMIGKLERRVYLLTA